MDARSVIRLRLELTGIVQGIGFRPYLYRLARELDLAGVVRNGPDGVELEVQGPAGQVDAFCDALPRDLPPMGSLTKMTRTQIEPEQSEGFVIEPSRSGQRPSVSITPDAHVCDACLAELRDPEDRRFRYPFINCVSCGPRYTIIESLPYDRPRTTMSTFPLCEQCEKEYKDPTDRRFHAQPIACPVCGPKVWLVGSGGPVEGDPIGQAARLILQDKIIAIKGVGGFHLAARAGSDRAVAQLRKRKGREGKPFAVMVADSAQLRQIAEATAAEVELLRRPSRPIVLVRARKGTPLLCPSVCGNLGQVGVMLAYAPVHHLLFDTKEMPPLVMTSGNVSEQPIVTDNSSATKLLAPLADAFLMHNRPIRSGCDDSVMLVHDDAEPVPIRRSRGLAPMAVPTTGITVHEPLLALGAEQRVTLCVGRPGELVVGPHLGNLASSTEVLDRLDGHARKLELLLGVTPRTIVHDLHPDYVTTRYARTKRGAKTIAVGHHHAHMASCLAENGFTPDQKAVGIIFDGTGYGPDGTIWGGEVLVGSIAECERAGHLRPVALPGGDQAIRYPARVALAYLLDAFGDEALELRLPCVTSQGATAVGNIAQMIRAGLRSPMSSGAGRLFDAVAAILGIGAGQGGAITFDGQPAMELEELAEPTDQTYPFELSGGIIDTRPLVRAVVADVLAGADPKHIASVFHTTLALAAAQAAIEVAEREGIDTVALSGGCFFNRHLSAGVKRQLTARGLVALAHRHVPPGDGGLSLGQAAYACAHLQKEL